MEFKLAASWGVFPVTTTLDQVWPFTFCVEHVFLCLTMLFDIRDLPLTHAHMDTHYNLLFVIGLAFFFFLLIKKKTCREHFLGPFKLTLNGLLLVFQLLVCLLIVKQSPPRPTPPPPPLLFFLSHSPWEFPCIQPSWCCLISAFFYWYYWKALCRAFIILYNFPTSKLTWLSKWQPPKSYSMIFAYLVFYLFIILTITHQEIPIELQGSWQFAYLFSGFICFPTMAITWVRFCNVTDATYMI